MGNNSVPLCNHKNTGLDNYNHNQNEISFLREEFRSQLRISYYNKFYVIMIRGPSKDVLSLTWFMCRNVSNFFEN